MTFQKVLQGSVTFRHIPESSFPYKDIFDDSTYHNKTYESHSIDLPDLPHFM